MKNAGWRVKGFGLRGKEFECGRDVRSQRNDNYDHSGGGVLGILGAEPE